MVRPKKGLGRLVVAGVAALLLALPALAAPLPAADLPPRILAIDGTTAVPSVPWKGFDANPPKLFDLDGDGDLELLAQNDNHWVYVFDTRSGVLLAEVTTSIPAGWTPRSFNGVEAGVLEPGEAPRVVVANSAATVTSFRYDAAKSTRLHVTLVKEWERKLDDCRVGSGMDSKPVFADLDRDGDLDILAATEDNGIFALRADGSLLWGACLIGGNAEPTVGDLDLDGWPDVVFGSDLGLVSVLDGRTGAVKWQVSLHDHFELGSGSIPNAITLGQIDGKGGPDLLLGARDSHDPLDWSNDHALLAAFDSSGRLLWGRQDPVGNPLTYTHPLLVDADGDGQEEIYWADWNTVGHYPPFEPEKMWALTGPAHVYRYDLAGKMVWRQTLAAWWSNKDLAILDADGDGTQEILANGPSAAGNHDGIWLLDPRTGAKEAFLDLFPWKLGRAAVAGDLYGTGTYQFVVEAAKHHPSAWGPAFLVYDTKASTIPAWPHLPYVSLDDQGKAQTPTASSIPKTPATTLSAQAPIIQSPPSASKPSGFNLEGLRALKRNGATTPSEPPSLAKQPDGSDEPDGPTKFHATFDVQSLPIGFQATPRPSAQLARVEARVDGGPWQPMARTLWGAWATLAAPGQSIELRAADATGQQAQSAPFPWPDDTIAITLGATFDATFAPVLGPAAAWWVETRVEAPATVASVTVRVGDAPPVALEPTAWGTWARSLRVPAGSQVVYEATAEDGRSLRWLAS